MLWCYMIVAMQVDNPCEWAGEISEIIIIHVSFLITALANVMMLYECGNAGGW